MFFPIAALLIAGIFGGSRHLLRLTQQQLEAEVTLRGSSLARQSASQIYDVLERGDSLRVNALSDGILREDDLRYIIITDRQGELLASRSRLNWRPMSMPNDLQAPVCRSVAPVIRPRRIGDEELYDIAVPLAPANAVLTEHVSENDSEAVCAGALHLGISRQTLLDHQRSAHMWTWGIGMFTLLSAVFGYLLLRKTVINPLLALSDALQKTPPEACRRMLEDTVVYGELGRLKAALRQTMQAHDQKTSHLRRSRTDIFAQSDTLRKKHEQQAVTLQRQSSSFAKLSEQSRENTQGLDSLGEHAQRAAESAATTIQQADEMETAVGKTMDSVGDVRRHVAANTERIVELGEKIAQISNVVKMINTIASQTKLIAFNAGIEAAGAGEAGGRFSIVATEVRRLANTVVESVEEITESASAIQTAASELILSSESSMRNVEQGVLQISATRRSLRALGECLKKNHVSLNELLEEIRLQGTQQLLVANGLKHMSLQWEELAEDVRHCREITLEIGAMAEELEENRQDS